MTRAFDVTPLARLDALSALEWYEGERVGLGDEFTEEVDHVFAGIRGREEFIVAPYARLPTFVVRRLFVSRFPFRVFFTETDTRRDVFAILRDGQQELHWQSRI